MPERILWEITQKDVKEATNDLGISLPDNEMFWDKISEAIVDLFNEEDIYNKIASTITKVIESYE